MSTEASIRADGERAAAEDQFGYHVDYHCTEPSCAEQWSVHVYEDEPEDEDVTCPYCKRESGRLA